MSCSDCEKGISPGCEKSCSEKRQSDYKDCYDLYGPLGSNDAESLEKCEDDAEKEYVDCNVFCPCAD